MTRNLIRTFSSAAKYLSEQSNLIKPEAFDFLQRCLESKFDMTSAEPLHPESTGIMPPSKIMQMECGTDFNDWKQFRGISRGEESTLQECVNFFSRHGIKCSKDNVSLSKNIISAIYQTYGKISLNDSEKILIPTPASDRYFQHFKDMRIGFNTISTLAEDGFLPNPQKLESAIIKSGSKALLLCYPNNATGAVMTKECAEVIADITKKHKVFVISDEAFVRNSLSQKQHFSIAAIDGVIDRSITITSAIEAMFIGRDIAFCVGNPDVINIFEQIGGYPKRDQRVLMAAIEDSAENREYLEKCRSYYLNNISLIKEKTAELNQKFCQQFGEEGVYVKPFIADPEATNVYLMDFSGLRGKQRNGKIMNTGLDAAKWLLEDASIGTVPGECFLFDEREMLVRITLNHTPKEIEMAFDSAAAAVSKIENSPSVSLASSNVKKLAESVLDLSDAKGAGISN